MRRATFAADRRDLLLASGLDAAGIEGLVDLQCRARERQYRQDWPGAEAWTIEVDAVPAGCLLLHRERGATRIVDFALRPEFRGRGVGGKVLGRLQSEAAGAGARLVLQVAADNRARALYARRGFAETADDGLYVEMSWPGGAPTAAWIKNGEYRGSAT